MALADVSRIRYRAGAHRSRHTKPSEAPLVAAAIAFGSLYLFSGSLLVLLANLDNQAWQQGSVAGRWMLLTLTFPALVFAAALYVYRARSAPRRD